MIGSEDPEYDEAGGATAITELFTYFSELVEDRKKNPKDDLITLFATAEIDGKKLEPLDVLGWCQIIVGAGNETTRNATTGGMLALIENPDQRRKLQQDPSLLRSAIEDLVDLYRARVQRGRILRSSHPGQYLEAPMCELLRDRSPDPAAGSGYERRALCLHGVVPPDGIPWGVSRHGSRRDRPDRHHTRRRGAPIGAYGQRGARHDLVSSGPCEIELFPAGGAPGSCRSAC